MKIDTPFIEKVKSQVNLVEIVGSHVLLKKTGANYVGLCPFHQERSPSFSVSETKQLFHCYGCKKGGDVIKFIMELHGTSFTEAIEELAEKARLPIPKAFGLDEALTPEQRKLIEEKKERTQIQYKLNRFVAKFYHDHLMIDRRTQDYLKSRGITPETQKLFYLGSTPFGWSPLSKKLIEAKAPTAIAMSMGLIRESKQPQQSGISTFDLFRNRVMFPILDVRGKVVGFGGRTLPHSQSEGEGDKGPKYLNSTESPLFQKSKILYGLYQSQKSIRAEDTVIIVEGYFDYLALYQAGFQNVVATCGTALSQEHLKVLKRIASKIILLFDSDKAGEIATLKSMELGLTLGVVLYAAVLPKGKDVDEVLYSESPEGKEAGKKEVRAILDGAEPLIDREIQALTRTSNKNIESKSAAVKQIGEWLRLFQDPIGRSIRVEKVCKDFGISEALLMQAVGGQGFSNPPRNESGNTSHFSGFNLPPQSFGGQKGSFGKPPSPVNKEPLKMLKKPLKTKPHVLLLDQKILKGLLLKGEFLEMFEESKGYLPEGVGLVDLVQHPDIRLIISQIIQGQNLTIEFQNEIEDEEVRTLFREALLADPQNGALKQVEAPFSIKDFQVVVRKALKEVWARFSHKLLNEMIPEMNGDQNFSKSQEWLDVQLKIKELDNFNDQNE